MLHSLLDFIRALDDGSLRWVNQFAGHSLLFDGLMGQLVNSELIKVGVLVAMLYWLWFKTDGDVHERRHRVIMALPSAAVAIIVGRAMALALPFRLRPFVREDLGWTPLEHFDTFVDAWSAFPSDTSMFTFAIATTIWLNSRRLGWLAWLYVAVVVCLPRWYTGLHHPSDLIAGAVIGIAIPLLVGKIALMRRMTDPIQGFADAQPGVFHALVFLTMYQLTTLFGGLRILGKLLLTLYRGG